VKKIRVLIAILGLDQHEVGAIAVSRALVDAGMEVIYAGRFNLPPMIVTTALQESVDVIGISCGSWEYLHYVPELMELLKENEIEMQIIVGGPIITPGDERALKEMGVAAVFGPSSTTGAIIEEVSKLVVDQER
jgi:methylmalonyl-CoA mutase C-terminal domain/subunit